MPMLDFLAVIGLTIVRPPHSVSDLNIRRQYGPDYGTGGDSHNHKPPEHPHDDLGYQTKLKMTRTGSCSFRNRAPGEMFRWKNGLPQ